MDKEVYCIDPTRPSRAFSFIKYSLSGAFLYVSGYGNKDLDENEFY